MQSMRQIALANEDSDELFWIRGVVNEKQFKIGSAPHECDVIMDGAIEDIDADEATIYSDGSAGPYSRERRHGAALERRRTRRSMRPACRVSAPGANCRAKPRQFRGRSFRRASTLSNGWRRGYVSPAYASIASMQLMAARY